jgi:pyruvate kinase
MDRIIREVESSPVYWTSMRVPDVDLPVSANAIARAASIAAKQMSLRTIAVVTGSGGAARLMSHQRPEAQLIALTTSESTFRQLAPYWGVTPLYLPPCSTTDELIVTVLDALVAKELVRSGEQVVLTAGVPVGSGATTNMLEITAVP